MSRGGPRVRRGSIASEAHSSGDDDDEDFSLSLDENKGKPHSANKNDDDDFEDTRPARSRLRRGDGSSVANSSVVSNAQNIKKRKRRTLDTASDDEGGDDNSQLAPSRKNPTRAAKPSEPMLDDLMIDGLPDGSPIKKSGRKGHGSGTEEGNQNPFAFEAVDSTSQRNLVDDDQQNTKLLRTYGVDKKRATGAEEGRPQKQRFVEKSVEPDDADEDSDANGSDFGGDLKMIDDDLGNSDDDDDDDDFSKPLRRRTRPKPTEGQGTIDSFVSRNPRLTRSGTAEVEGRKNPPRSTRSPSTPLLSPIKLRTHERRRSGRLQHLRRNYKDTDNDDSASASSSDSGNISAEASDDEVKRQLEKEASDSGDEASESEDSTEAREKLEKKDRQARRFPNPEAEKAKEAKKKKSKKNTRKDSSSSDSDSDAEGRGAGSHKISNADVSPIAVDASVTWDSVGGLNHYIASLKEVVILPLLYPEMYERLGISPPRGVLFSGPPGTGKTLVARALAGECNRMGKNVAFFVRKGSDILSKWVGEAERQLRLLFDEARKRQPSIIFFDEIDGLAPVRSSKNDAVHGSIVSTLLALMDGVEGRGQIVIIGATNRVDAVDPALRRPGRFDREFQFQLPSKLARLAILNVHMRDWNPPVDEEFKRELAEKCVGYCGADIKALCTEAALRAIRRHFPQIYNTTNRLLLDPSQVVVTHDDFGEAMKDIVPASFRPAGVHARPLIAELEPLLNHSFIESQQKLGEIFILPPSKINAEASQDPELDLYDFDSVTPSASMLMTKAVHRPILLIHGDEGDGQHDVAAAILNLLEEFAVTSVDIQSLHADSGAKSIEESFIRKVTEIARKPPGVVFLPRINEWWDNASGSLQATFVQTLRDASPNQKILFLITSSVSYGALDESVRTLLSREWIAENPDRAMREKFFAPLLTLVQAPIPKRKPRPKKLKALPLAPDAMPSIDMDSKPAPGLDEREKQITADRIFRQTRWQIRNALNVSKKDTGRLREYLNDYHEPLNLATLYQRNEDGYYRTIKEFYNDLDAFCGSIRAFLESTSVAQSDDDFELRMRPSELKDEIVTEIDDDRLDHIQQEAEKISSTLPRCDPTALVLRTSSSMKENRRSKGRGRQQPLNRRLSTDLHKKDKEHVKQSKEAVSNSLKPSRDDMDVDEPVSGQEDIAAGVNGLLSGNSDTPVIVTTKESDPRPLIEAAAEQGDELEEEPEVIPEPPPISFSQRKLDELKLRILEATQHMNVDSLHRLYARMKNLIRGYLLNPNRNELLLKLRKVVPAMAE